MKKSIIYIGVLIVCFLFTACEKNDSELSDCASQIDKIISMPNPYSNIKKLPELNNKFNTRFDEILEDKKIIVLNGINNDFESVISRLTTDELKDKFEIKVNSKFESLKNKLSLEKNIAIINGIITESDNLKSSLANEINSYIESISRPPQVGAGNNGGQEIGGSDVRVPIEVDIDIITITESPNKKFKSESDIDEFLQKLKAELKNKLENADIINLKL